MKVSVLFIHSAGPQSLFEGSSSLVEHLQQSLGEQFHVICPKMPSPENPRYEQWKDRLRKEIDCVGDELVMVGHSLGASILLKYLSEESVIRPVTGLFLVAAPFWGDKDWEIDEFVLRKDFATKILNIPAIFMYHCRDDVWVPFEHLHQYAKKIPGAIIRALHGDEHEFYNGLPGLAGDIKAVCANLNKLNFNS